MCIGSLTGRATTWSSGLPSRERDLDPLLPVRVREGAQRVLAHTIGPAGELDRAGAPGQQRGGVHRFGVHPPELRVPCALHERLVGRPEQSPGGRRTGVAVDVAQQAPFCLVPPRLQSAQGERGERALRNRQRRVQITDVDQHPQQFQQMARGDVTGQQGVVVRLGVGPELPPGLGAQECVRALEQDGPGTRHHLGGDARGGGTVQLGGHVDEGHRAGEIAESPRHRVRLAAGGAVAQGFRSTAQSVLSLREPPGGVGGSGSGRAGSRGVDS